MKGNDSDHPPTTTQPGTTAHRVGAAVAVLVGVCLCSSGRPMRADTFHPSVGVFLASAGETDPARAITVVRSLGVDLIQVSNLPKRFYTPEGARELAGLMKSAGIRAGSVVIVFDGESYADRASVERTVGFRPVALIPERQLHARRCVDLAAALGSRIVTFHVGFLPKQQDDAVYQAMVRATADLAQYASQKDVTVSLETGQETAEELEAFLAKLGPAHVGVNFDTANLVLYGMDSPPGALRRLLPHVTSVHVKDGLLPASPGALGREVRLGEGRAEVAECLRILREANFKGPLIVENYVWRELKTEPRSELRRALSFIQREVTLQ